MSDYVEHRKWYPESHILSDGTPNYWRYKRRLWEKTVRKISFWNWFWRVKTTTRYYYPDKPILTEQKLLLHSPEEFRP